MMTRPIRAGLGSLIWSQWWWLTLASSPRASGSFTGCLQPCHHALRSQKSFGHQSRRAGLRQRSRWGEHAVRRGCGWAFLGNVQPGSASPELDPAEKGSAIRKIDSSRKFRRPMKYEKPPAMERGRGASSLGQVEEAPCDQGRCAGSCRPWWQPPACRPRPPSLPCRRRHCLPPSRRRLPRRATWKHACALLRRPTANSSRPSSNPTHASGIFSGSTRNSASRSRRRPALLAGRDRLRVPLRVRRANPSLPGRNLLASTAPARWGRATKWCGGRNRPHAP